MGNLRKDIYRNGSSDGSGSVVGNIKNGIVRKGGNSGGGGSVVGNVKDGIVRKGGNSGGGGSTIGKTKDYAFKGSATVGEAEAVALYHFLEKEIF